MGYRLSEQAAQERNSTYLREFENYFRTHLVDDYPARAADAWSREYSDTENYRRSIESMRAAWKEVLSPPELAPAGEFTSTADWLPGTDSWWLELPLQGGLSAQAGLAIPSDGASGLVVFQHGLGSTPERAFGVGDERGVYDHVGQRLLDAGYAVLAPLNLTQVGPRNRAQRLARLAGTTVEGVEFARLQLLLTELETVFEICTDRMGLWGSSWGGMATQMWAPLDERFTVAVTSGFFNHRRNKMVVQDTRHVTFEDTGEDHAFLPGHLSYFSDADLASLICPRPFLVQIGKKDAIGWWPDIVTEFDDARQHWDRLGLSDQVDIDLHDDGHVVRSAVGVEWISRWMEAGVTR